MEAAVERIVRKVFTEELGVFRTGLLREIESMIDRKVHTLPGPVGSPWVPQAHGYYGSQSPAVTAVAAQSGKKKADKAQAATEDQQSTDPAKRGWTAEMEAELESLIKQQVKGEEPVSEDRIAWQVIRALSNTMGHLSKDAIRKKGKRMLSRQEKDSSKKPTGEAIEEGPLKRMRTESNGAPATSTAAAAEPVESNSQPAAAALEGASDGAKEEPTAQAGLPPPALPHVPDTAPTSAD